MMTTPDWKDAPEWAMFLAMDSNGSWYWFERQPKSGRTLWIENDGLIQSAGEGQTWADSLTIRPKQFMSTQKEKKQ